MPHRIRVATAADASGVLRVYAPYVLKTTVSFELEVPAVGEYAARIADALQGRTFLVVEDTAAGGGTARVVGFAYYGPFGHRAAYQWSAETSIYLEEALTGKGVGAELLSCLEEIMRAAGITNSEACICTENEGSIAFHERHGYRCVGEFRRCASKFGRWLGIQWLEKHLSDHPSDPVPPHAPDPADVDRAVARANERLEARRAPTR